jgi:hypothetical protein
MAWADRATFLGTGRAAVAQSEAAELEIVILHHQFAVLRPKVPRPEPRAANFAAPTSADGRLSLELRSASAESAFSLG